MTHGLRRMTKKRNSLILAIIAAGMLGPAGSSEPQQSERETRRAPDIYLKDYQPRSMMVADYHLPQKAKFPAIDVHNHLGRASGPRTADPAAVIREMDAAGVAQVVNLDGGWGEDLKATIAKYDKAYPGRFLTYARVDWSRIEEPGFGEKAAAQLEADVKAGARGLKIAKHNLGLAKDSKGQFIPVDDPRTFPIWRKAGELKIPVEVHVGDPAAFFTPLDRFNERYDELQDHPNWLFYPGYPPTMPIPGAGDTRVALLWRPWTVAKHTPPLHLGSRAQVLLALVGQVGPKLAAVGWKRR